MEIALNVDEGRAALYWLPDPALHAAEPDMPAHPRPVPVWSYREEGRREVPGVLARVTAGIALAAAREYVATGARPTVVAWLADTSV